MSLVMHKRADGETASVLPTIAVPSYPAQDKNTLTGMVPPIAYTKVNASTPPVPDAGATAQKSLAPMGAQMLPKTAQAFREDPTMNMTPRPLVQDLVKQAMASAHKRVQVAAEGARQTKLASAPQSEPAEENPGSVPTDYALKLAAAVEFATPVMVEMSKGAAPNMPPPHLTETEQKSPEGVSQSAVGGTMPGPGQQGKGHHQPPTNPGEQKAMPQEHGATQLENTMKSPPGGTGEQTTAMSGGKGKTASFEKNLAALKKFAGKPDFSPEMQTAIEGGISPEHVRQLALQHAGETTEGLRERADYAGEHPIMNRAKPIGIGATLGGLGGAALGGLVGGGSTKGIGIGGGVGAALGGLAGLAASKSPDAHAQEAAAHEQALQALQGGGIDPALRHQAMNMASNGGYGEEGGIPDERGQAIRYLMNQQQGGGQPKQASAQISPAEMMLQFVKQAEDAINPASISAGPAVPPDTSASGEAGGAPVAGMPQGPSSLIGSNEAAINYKKQTAYAPRKSELAQYFVEPALSAATDKTLHEAFAHTGEAGVKISSVQTVKSAAMRALLMKLAKKEKDSFISAADSGKSLGPLARRTAVGALQHNAKELSPARTGVRNAMAGLAGGFKGMAGKK